MLLFNHRWLLFVRRVKWHVIITGVESKLVKWNKNNSTPTPEWTTPNSGVNSNSALELPISVHTVLLRVIDMFVYDEIFYPIYFMSSSAPLRRKVICSLLFSFESWLFYVKGIYLALLQPPTWMQIPAYEWNKWMYFFEVSITSHLSFVDGLFNRRSERSRLSIWEKSKQWYD